MDNGKRRVLSRMRRDNTRRYLRKSATCHGVVYTQMLEQNVLLIEGGAAPSGCRARAWQTRETLAWETMRCGRRTSTVTRNPILRNERVLVADVTVQHAGPPQMCAASPRLFSVAAPDLLGAEGFSD